MATDRVGLALSRTRLPCLPTKENELYLAKFDGSDIVRIVVLEDRAGGLWATWNHGCNGCYVAKMVYASWSPLLTISPDRVEVAVEQNPQ